MVYLRFFVIPKIMWQLLFLITVAVSPKAWAATVSDLYSAEVYVQSQSREERETGMRSALAAVLVKLTGMRQSTVSPDLNEAFENASRFAAQYRYRELAKTVTDGSTPPAPFVLSVGFDKKALDRLLERLGIPLWGSTRPQVLVWLAVQEAGGRRYMVEPELYPQIRDAVIERGKDRGIPIAFPLFDLDDQRGVQLSDVWGNFPDNVLRASQRYRADAVLVGRVHQDDLGRWIGRWALYQKDGVVNWDGTGQSLAAAVGGGVEHTADTLAQRFVYASGIDGQQRVLVALVDVTDLAQYGRAINYLSGLDVVKMVQVNTVTAQHVLLDVSVNGDTNTLRQVVGLSSVLREAVDTPPNTGAEPDASAPSAAAILYRVMP